MQSDGTIGDKIALCAMSKIFNIEFEATSNLEPVSRQIITQDNSVAMTRSHLGHFAEKEVTHCVALNPNQEDFVTRSFIFFRIRKSTKEKEPMLCPTRNSCLIIEIDNFAINVIDFKKQSLAELEKKKYYLELLVRIIWISVR